MPHKKSYQTITPSFADSFMVQKLWFPSTTGLDHNLEVEQEETCFEDKVMAKEGSEVLVEDVAGVGDIKGFL